MPIRMKMILLKLLHSIKKGVKNKEKLKAAVKS
jgi:hypothetical protein